MRKGIYLTATLLLLPGFTAVAQEQGTTLEFGQRVRVTAPVLGIEEQAATFERLQGDTLVVTTDSTMHYPLAAVTRLDVHRGRHGHALTVAAIGFGAGTFIGAITAVIICENAWCDVDGGVILLGAGIGSITGAVLGAGVGALIKTDRWEEVPLDRLRVSVSPQQEGRLAFSVSLRF